jgi:hypothetical protein
VRRRSWGAKWPMPIRLAYRFHGIPDYVGCHSFILPSPILRNSSEHLAFSHSRVVDPNIYETFTPRRYGDRSQSSARPNHIDDHPVAFPQLQLVQS